MHKLLIFDLDGTLAAIGKGIPPEALTLLKELEKDGHRIAICSGKPTYYLCGFCRQAGLENPILIGENGANIQFGIELPPKEFYIYPYSMKTKSQLQELKRKFEQYFVDKIWFQPNLVDVTVFPKTEKESTEIEEFLKGQSADLRDVNIYRHADSFDITPKEINKYNGLKYLSELTDISSKEMIAIGDGVNDIPMFEYAGYSIGIGNQLKSCKNVDICFENILEALIFLKKYVK